jgi:hypothetical protein
MDRTVDCIAPEWLVRFHTGYQVDATDWADVSALCERFGIPVRATTRDSARALGRRPLDHRSHRTLQLGP